MPTHQRSEHVTVDRGADGVAHVRLARPDKLNALTLGMLDDLVRTARSLGRDHAVRAVVLSGEARPSAPASTCGPR
ncbi:hypothetical protein BJF80_01505 [Serinicoccus sp. CUA-874]|uniref:enoyl-CoA hydratase-related protein n=1 Tax=Serinicoccus sp. CUA-874 TaxID=1517939 RepID=UPI000969013F|nr:enoyl-CoA hydratase-related protein [Serinicoccus sp. CUA-874]OLT18004.1 hypothetical protein BJF80_01505 [Serinicoccus sp. CUA-874]